jgi:hypothetical protein
VITRLEPKEKKTMNRTTLQTTILLALLVSACGGGEANSTPTVSVEMIQTAAVSTFADGLTMTALFAPSSTPTITSTPTLSLPLPTLSNVTPVGGGLPGNPTASCYRLAYVSDVSIPDNTAMTPGQEFTKTWRVRNSGSCAWDVGFKLSFTGGDAMNGQTYILPQLVPANTEINLSVNMKAPAKAGTTRGNWRMSTASGAFFGEEVYVQIVVGGTTGTAGPTNTTAPAATTAAPTPTGTTAPPPTPTTTPETTTTPPG